MMLALLLLLGDDLAEHRRMFLDAVTNINDAKAAEAIAKISGFDGKEGVDALLAGVVVGGKIARTLEQERERWLRVMEANAYDPEAKRWRGPVDKYNEAKAKYEEACAKLARLETISAAAGQGLAGMKSDAAVQELLARFRSDGPAALRSLVAGALARAAQPDVAPALAAQLRKEKEASVRVALIDALRGQAANGGEIVDLLCAALRDEFWQVKIAAAQALKAVKARDAVEPLIGALKGADGRVRSEINDALVAITGADKHGDEGAWRSWWERNRGAFLAGTYVPEPAERGRAAGGTTFYGLPVTSKRIVFVLDRSGSMAGKAKWKPEDLATGAIPAGVPRPKGDRKIDVAKYELKKVLAMLPDGVEFNIVFYNRIMEPMAEKMLVLNKETRRRAGEFIDPIEPAGYTNISGGLEKGFSFSGLADRLSKSGVDTIYLLSDGMPTAGITDPDELCRHVAAANRVRKIVIHAIAIEPGTESEKLMKRVAGENRGSYVKR